MKKRNCIPSESCANLLIWFTLSLVMGAGSDPSVALAGETQVTGNQVFEDLKSVLGHTELNGFHKWSYENDEEALSNSDEPCTLNWISDPKTGFSGIQLDAPLAKVGVHDGYSSQFLVDPNGSYNLKCDDDYRESPEHLYQQHSYVGNNDGKEIFNEILVRPKNRTLRVFLRKVKDTYSNNWEGDGIECIFRY